MIIKAPINSYDDLLALLPYSISEAYLGLDLSNLLSGNLNRQSCGVKSFRELNSVINLAHNHNIRIHLALNNHYNHNQLEKIKGLFISLKELSIDGIIVSDLSLLEWIKEQNFSIPVTASVLLSVMNSQSAYFLSELYGIQNFVLAYHLTVQEIVSICTRNPHLHFEVLALNYGCYYEDGFCNMLHSKEETSRKADFLFKILKPLKQRLVSFIHSLPNFMRNFFYQNIIKLPPCSLSKNDFKISKGKEYLIGIKQIAWKRQACAFLDKCGICAFYDFYQCGLHGIKIAGRDLPLFKKVRDVQMVHEAIALARNAESKKSYISQARTLFKKYKGFSCDKNYCYFQGIFDE